MRDKIQLASMWGWQCMVAIRRGQRERCILEQPMSPHIYDIVHFEFKLSRYEKVSY